MLTDIQAVVFAAGKSTRFNNGTNKLIETICGQEIIIYPLSVLHSLSIPTTVIMSSHKEKIKTVIARKHPHKVHYQEQKEITGTAAAVREALPHLSAAHILVMKGDVPLITPSLIEALYSQHRKRNATISCVAAHNGDPTGFAYSRIINHNDVTYIRKIQELTPKEIEEHCCVNAGIYLISRSFLEQELPHLEKNSTTQEYHISDLVNRATQQRKTVITVTAPFDQIRGINTHQELWAIEHIKRSELIKKWMEQGVRFSSAHTAHLDLDVTIGPGTVIGCSVQLLSGTIIGTHCSIQPFTLIEDSTLGDNVTIASHSIVRNASIGSHSTIGPFAHIQHDSLIGDACTIGNFVETKRVHIGNHTKAKHLSYLADAQIDAHVNIGAGTITCNYDGKQKQKTEIKEGAFIGSNNCLVAPVTIGKKSFTGAGSTITQAVPNGALAIARARQINKEGYFAFTTESEPMPSSTEQEKKSFSFIGAYKTHNDGPTTDS